MSNSGWGYMLPKIDLFITPQGCILVDYGKDLRFDPTGTLQFKPTDLVVRIEEDGEDLGLLSVDVSVDELVACWKKHGREGT